MKKINLIWFLSIFLMLFILSACTTNDESKEDAPLVEKESQTLNFRSLVKSNQSSYQEEGFYVINNQEEWNNLGIVIIEDYIIEIDFEKELVLAVFTGMRPSGGYSVEIVEIIEKEDVIEVMFEETMPSEDDMVSMEITYPEHIVKIEKIDKPFEFIKK